jgi:hypothetical protein
MQIIRTKAIAKLKVTEAEVVALEAEIALNPTAGDVCIWLWLLRTRFIFCWLTASRSRPTCHPGNAKTCWLSLRT